MLSRNRKRKKQMTEINVVPYIDVMLVLLIIFMVTAPLLTQGVNVSLPQADAEPIKQEDNEPVVVSIDREGRYYVDSGENPDEPVEADVLVNRVAAFIRNNPEQPVYIKGDKEVPYGRVVSAMALLQKAGVPNVGMLTDPAEADN